jgi:hypothetical protein
MDGTKVKSLGAIAFFGFEAILIISSTIAGVIGDVPLAIKCVFNK